MRLHNGGCMWEQFNLSGIICNEEDGGYILIYTARYYLLAVKSGVKLLTAGKVRLR